MLRKHIASKEQQGAMGGERCEDISSCARNETNIEERNSIKVKNPLDSFLQLFSSVSLYICIDQHHWKKKRKKRKEILF